MASKFGGIPIEEQPESRFGGIPVNEPSESQFGGVPVGQVSFDEAADVPEWGAENPNLYGLYGAGKGLLEQAGRPVVEAVGMIAGGATMGAGGTAVAPGVGTAAGIATGGALGYGMAKKGMDIVEEWYASIGEEEPVRHKNIAEKYVAKKIRGTAGKVAGEVAGSAQDVGEFIAMGKAFDVAIPIVKKGAEVIFKDLPQKLYGSATRMSLAKGWIKDLPGKEVSKRTEAIEEGIRSRIRPSKQGVLKAKKNERDVRAFVDEVVDIVSKNPNEQIEVSGVIERGLAKAYRKAANSGDPVGAKKTIATIAEKFKAHGTTITPKKANQIKRELYKEVSWGEGVDGITKSAKKGLAHDLMVQLEGTFPELKKLNATDSARIHLIEAIEHAVALKENKNLISPLTKIIALHKWPLAVFEMTLGHPRVKAELAFLLARANPKKYGRYVFPDKPTPWKPSPKAKKTEVYRYQPESQVGRTKEDMMRVGILEEIFKGVKPVKKPVHPISRQIKRETVLGKQPKKTHGVKRLIAKRKVAGFAKKKGIKTSPSMSKAEIKKAQKKATLSELNKFRKSKGLKPVGRK